MVSRSLVLAVVIAFQIVVDPELGNCGAPTGERTPVLYSTDLYQPHVDPDDHFDLATLMAIGKFEILGIILDDGAKQLQTPGRIPLQQMFQLTGRKVPYAIGLKPSLRSPADSCASQPEVFQQGVELILRQLRESPTPVTIFTTGSLRDVAAAFNREPQLLKDKIARLYINIGNVAANKNEWNVQLDERAFACILQSDLPIYWCPCFGKSYGTHWRFVQDRVLATAPPRLQNFFVFALTTGNGWQGPVPTGTDDPASFLSQSVDPASLEAVGRLKRSMWCTAPFLHAAGYDPLRRENDDWIVAPIYDFVPARVKSYRDGLTTVEELSPSAPSTLRIFKILDPEAYELVMTSCLRALFREFPVADGRSSAND